MIYIFLEAFKGFGKNKSMSFITMGIIAVSIFIFGLFITGTANLMKVIKIAEDKIEMIAYINDDVSDKDIQILEKQISTIVGVQSIEFISKEKALEAFKKDLGNDSDLLNVFQINPLPASIKININMAYKTPKYLDEIANKISLFEGINDIEYGADWVKELDKWIKILFLIDVIIGIIIALASIFIVFNTIRLTVYARKEQIDIMDLVGATENYIEIPYIIEGIIHGIIGSSIALIILYFIFSFIRTKFIDIIYINNFIIYSLLVFGIVLGYIGSFMSVKQCLGEIKEKKQVKVKI